MDATFKLLMLAISIAMLTVFLIGGVVAITGFKMLLEQAIG